LEFFTLLSVRARIECNKDTSTKLCVVILGITSLVICFLGQFFFKVKQGGEAIHHQPSATRSVALDGLVDPAALPGRFGRLPLSGRCVALAGRVPAPLSALSGRVEIPPSCKRSVGKMGPTPQHATTYWWE
jgi:hypothetical protein